MDSSGEDFVLRGSADTVVSTVTLQSPQHPTVTNVVESNSKRHRCTCSSASNSTSTEHGDNEQNCIHRSPEAAITAIHGASTSLTGTPNTFLKKSECLVAEKNDEMAVSSTLSSSASSFDDHDSNKAKITQTMTTQAAAPKFGFAAMKVVDLFVVDPLGASDRIREIPDGGIGELLSCDDLSGNLLSSGELAHAHLSNGGGLHAHIRVGENPELNRGRQVRQPERTRSNSASFTMFGLGGNTLNVEAARQRKAALRPTVDSSTSLRATPPFSSLTPHLSPQ